MPQCYMVLDTSPLSPRLPGLPVSPTRALLGRLLYPKVDSRSYSEGPPLTFPGPHRVSKPLRPLWASDLVSFKIPLVDSSSDLVSVLFTKSKMGTRYSLATLRCPTKPKNFLVERRPLSPCHSLVYTEVSVTTLRIFVESRL